MKLGLPSLGRHPQDMYQRPRHLICPKSCQSCETLQYKLLDHKRLKILLPAAAAAIPVHACESLDLPEEHPHFKLAR